MPRVPAIVALAGVIFAASLNPAQYLKEAQAYPGPNPEQKAKILAQIHAGVPANAAGYLLGTQKLYAGQYREAIDLFDQTGPSYNYQLWYYQAAWAHLGLRETTRAASYIDDYLTADVADPGGLIWSVRAVLMARFNNRKAANESIAEAVDNRDSTWRYHHMAYSIGSAYAMMNDPSDALYWLEEAVRNGLPCAPLLRTDPNLASLKSSANFQTLIQEAEKISAR